nr:MAG TPA: hypothetical protein [Caudoviricetes sp.]
MIVTVIIGIIIGIPLLLAVVWMLNMLWLSLVNLYRSLTGSSKPHGCPFDYPETIKRIFRG